MLFFNVQWDIFNKCYKLLLLSEFFSVHCLVALDFGAGVEQPFDCLIVQNRQAVQSMRRSMDWTLEDNVVDGLFFCATLTCYGGGHTSFVQARAETSDTVAEAVKPDPGCSWEVIPRGWVPVSGLKVRSLVELSADFAYHWWSAHTASKFLVCLLDVFCVRRWQSFNGFTCEKAKALPVSLAKVPTLHRIAVGRNLESRWRYEGGPVLWPRKFS